MTYEIETNGFAGGAAERLADWLILEATREPFERGEAILVDAEGEPERLSRASLVGRMRAGGMASLARRLERTVVPTGHTLALVLGQTVEVKTMRTDNLVQRLPAPPGPRDDQVVPGEPWRRGRWVAPLDAAKGGR